MKNHTIYILVIMFFAPTVAAMGEIHDESSFKTAIMNANNDPYIHTLIFRKDAVIKLTSPIIYSGSQSISFIGNGVVIDGSKAGKFKLKNDLSVVTEDASFVMNTRADLKFENMSIHNSATTGIVINIPVDASGPDIHVSFENVKILNSRLFGLYINEKENESYHPDKGNSIGITLHISKSIFIGNGTGAIDIDGIRVNERGQGDINTTIIDSLIDNSGGDGIELDESGYGDVIVSMINVNIDGNGFFNKEDFDDGFDIDERHQGNIRVSLSNVTVMNNKQEGLDFDESGEGDIDLQLEKLIVNNNNKEGLQLNEEDAGNIFARLKKVLVSNNSDDGIQFTETDAGRIDAVFFEVTSNNNAKYGIKAEQWSADGLHQLKDETGRIRTIMLTQKGNAKGNRVKTKNVLIKDCFRDY